jgi:hypothetical protein
MTVTELIAHLRCFDGDHRVVVRGYEEGVDDILPPRGVEIVLDVHDEDWNGPHDMVESAGEPAILIAGVRPR